jgi:hypothetical protein
MPGALDEFAGRQFRHGLEGCVEIVNRDSRSAEGHAAPLRMRNLAGLILDHTLVERGDGWWIQIPAAETKQKIRSRCLGPKCWCPTSKLISRIIDRALRRYAGSGKGASSDALWL